MDFSKENLKVEIESGSADDEVEINVDSVYYPAEEEISRTPLIFEENVTISIGDPHAVEADGFVNFCMGTVHSGNDTFLRTHQLAGDELKNACHKIRGIGPGFARVTDSFGFNNVKHIIHAVLPMVETKFVGVFPHLAYLAVISSLDAAIEYGMKTVVMCPPFAIEPNVGCYLMLLAIKKWKRDNPNRLDSIAIVCEADTDFISFHHQIPALEEVEDFSSTRFDDLFPTLQYTIQDYGNTLGYAYSDYGCDSYSGNGEGFEYDENGTQIRKVEISFAVSHLLPKTENVYEQRSLIRNIQLNTNDPDNKEIDKLYQEMFYLSDGGICLQLSRNLSPTMLPIEEPDGRIRQYRLTTHSKNGDAYYFRCSHCEFLSKKTDTQYKPKMTVRDGSIVGNYYPAHHPECVPITKRNIIVQQLDRQARCKIMDQNMMMRQMYERENGIEIEINESELKLPEEAAETAAGIAGASKIRFPTWEQVRKQYYRLKAKGEKKAAAKQRRGPNVPFVEAPPIFIYPNENTSTEDVIQRAERQFDAETYGLKEEVLYTDENTF